MQLVLTALLVHLTAAVVALSLQMFNLAVFIAASLSLLVALYKGLFRIRMAPDVTSQLPKILSATLWAVTASFITSSILDQDPEPEHFGILLVGLVLAMTIGTHTASLWLKRLWRAGHLRTPVIVLGNTRLTPEVATELLVRRSYGADVVALINTDNFPADGEELQRIVKTRAEETNATRLIIGPFNEHSPAVLRAARWAGTAGLAVYVVPRLFEMGVGLDSLTPERVRGYPLVRVQPSAHPVVSLWCKRVFDVVASSAALLLLAPVMAAAALAVKLTSRGPILFSQERVGRHGNPIMVHKFRSMTQAGEPDTEWVSEERVTRIGSFLRRSAIDELPQLFSILVGEMSLVGPRPERPAFVEQFRQEFGDYDERHRMAPGLTGLAQIVGLVGDTPIGERVKYDNLYIDHWSFAGDMEILLKTAWAVVNQRRFKQRQIDLDSELSTRRVEIAATFFEREPEPEIIDLRTTSDSDDLTPIR